MRFLGLGLSDPVPDANTIWTFREALTRAELAGKPAIEVLFSAYEAALRQAGFLAMGGQIVDATVVAAPKQRNTEAEKADLKAGRVPDAWRAQPARLAQKDRDARWTIKWSKAKPAEDGAKRVDIAVPAFGYKNHVGIDRRHGLIRTWLATDAARHDGTQLPGLVSKANTAGDVWADTAYRSKANEAHLAANGFRSRIHRQEAAGQADGEERRPHQRREVEGSRRRRARLRPAEGTDGARRAHHRPGAGEGEDRAGQPRVQYEPGGLAHRLPDEDGLSIAIEAFRPGSGRR
ncbi:transposase [Methylobacterium planeticum]|uniref:transposase n=1 Tax=Methylobacterium planeticum TaxID=2615211 RepID=UPI001FED70FD|nr:transposase [Methylobacterium planeticum]